MRAESRSHEAASGSTPLLPRRPHHTDLGQEPQYVLLRPLLNQLPVRDAVNRYRRHRQGVAGAWSTRQVAFVLSNRREARHDLVPFGNLLVDAVIPWSRIPEYPECLLQPFASRCQARKWWRVVVEVILSHELIHGIEIAFVDLFVKPAHEHLIFLA